MNNPNVTSGGELRIDDALKTMVDAADAALQKIVDSSEKKTKEVAKMFKDLADTGFVDLIAKLDEVNSKMAGLGNIGDGQGGVKGLSAMTFAISEMVKALDAANIDSAMSKLQKTIGSLNKVTDEVSDSKKYQTAANNIVQLAEALNKLYEIAAKNDNKIDIKLSNVTGGSKKKIEDLGTDKKDYSRKTQYLIDYFKELEKGLKQQQKIEHEITQQQIKELAESIKQTQQANREKEQSEQKRRQEYTAIWEDYFKEQEKKKKEELELDRQIAIEQRNIKEKKAKDDEHELDRLIKEEEKAQKEYLAANKRMLDEENKARDAANKKRRQQVIEAFREQEQQQKDYANYVKQQISDELKLAKKKNELEESLNKRNYQQKQREIEAAFAEYDKKSYAERITTIKKLIDARNKLKKTDSDYEKRLKILNEEINNHKNQLLGVSDASGEVAKSQRSLMDISGQLKRRLALVFSVSQITGYVKQLASVRGEFELQQRSLQSILKNKDKADEIWDKVTKLAVKSPFTVQELTSYTKQLAAYQIETDKLYGTMKRLADVSAGLGVDMQRIILAYGQVKAAQYLRASEVRQFTEAGIPMYAELAKYLSEVKGRMVDVGEIAMMTQKRLISFEDVEAVFKRMTDQGGIFYRMQEIQADTLKGQISNLKDSISLMMNEIGKMNEGALKGSVSLVRELAEHWKQVAAVLEGIGIGILAKQLFSFGAGLAFAFNAKKINAAARAGAALRLTLLDLRGGFSGLLKFLKGSWIGIATAAVALIGTLIAKHISHKREIEAANKKYDEMNERLVRSSNTLSETARNIEYNTEAIKQYKEMLSEAEEGSEDYKEAKDKLNEAEKENIRLLNILKTDFPDVYGKMYKDGAVDIKKMNNAVADMNNEMAAQIVLNDKMKGAGIYDFRYEDVSERLDKNIKDVEAFITSLREKLARLQAQSIVNQDFEKAKYWKNIIDKISDFDAAVEYTYRNLGKFPKEVSKEFNKLNTEILLMQSYMGSFSSWFEDKDVKASIKTWFDELLTFYKIDDESNRLGMSTEKFAQRIYDYFGFANISEQQQQKIKQNIEKIITEAYPTFEIDPEQFWKLPEPKKQEFTGWLKYFDEFVKKTKAELAERYKDTGLDLSSLILDYKQDSKESDVAKKVKQYVDDLTAAVETQKRHLQNELFTEEGRKSAKKDLELLQLQLEYYQKLYDYLDIVEKKKKSKSEADIYKERASAIMEANKEFEKLNKTFNKSVANKKVTDAYSETFQQLGLDIKDIDFKNLEGVSRALKNLITNTSKITDPATRKKVTLELQKMLDGVTAEIGIKVKEKEYENLQKDIDKMFENYKLSLEIEKIGIPKGIAEKLFGDIQEGFEFTDIDALKKFRDEQFSINDMSNWSEEMKKLYEKLQTDITKIENEAAKERIDTYVKYLKKSMSERLQIQIQYLKDLKQIDETNAKLGNAEGKLSTDALKQRMQKDLDKQMWEDFKGSDMYIEIFKELEYQSTRVLSMMKKRLEELKGSLKNLDPSQVKELVGQFSKLEDILIKRNPFKMFRELRKSAKKIKKDFGSPKEIDKELFAEQEEAAALKKQLQDLELILTAKEQGFEIDKVSGMIQEESKKYLSENENSLKETIKNKKEELATTEANVQKLKEGKETYDSYKKSINECASRAQEFGEQMLSVYNNAVGLGEQLGWIEEDDPFAGLVASLLEFLNFIPMFIAAMTAAGETMKSAMGIIGLIATAINAVISLIRAFATMKDKKITKEIDKIERDVRRLERDYEELEEAFDRAFDERNLRDYTKEMEENVQKQIDLLDKEIELEEDRKKKDKDKIEELENQKAELEKGLIDEKEKLIKSLGGIGASDYASLAQEFADAWYEAFKETGNGISGLDDKWDDFTDNFIKKMLLVKGSQRILEQFFTAFDKQIEEGMTGSDWAAMQQEWETKYKPMLDEYYKGVYDMFGNIGGTADSLTTLREGLQGMTEQTAEVIEGYLNSIRMLVSDTNLKLTSLVNSLMSSTSQNPILLQLQAQTGYLRDIDEKLASVIGRGQSKTHSGAYIKAFA